MADDAIVFALANPDPEIDPGVAQHHAAIVATGRSDYPNQINNVLAFPGIFRGLLDAQARGITDAMLLAASAAIADVVAEPNPLFIVPSVFDSTVAPAVASAVRRVSEAERDAEEGASIQEALDAGAASAESALGAETE
jgi:malate dehydrogenase (oxaloacetate-decarboxylating)